MRRAGGSVTICLVNSILFMNIFDDGLALLPRENQSKKNQIKAKGKLFRRGDCHESKKRKNAVRRGGGGGGDGWGRGARVQVVGFIVWVYFVHLLCSID